MTRLSRLLSSSALSALLVTALPVHAQEVSSGGGSVSGFVFCDLDNDGEDDPGEPGIADALLRLRCTGPDGSFGTGDDFVRTTRTDANGDYSFTGVPPGRCRLHLIRSSVPDKLLGRCPVTLNLQLKGGDVIVGANFCMVEPGSIGDTVFCDTNDDGIQDPGEPGIPGVRVDLRCAGRDGILGNRNDFTASTVTDDAGEYLFPVVPPGPCEISVDVDTAPPDKDLGRCPLVFAVDLAPGQAFLDADYCFVPRDQPARIGDTVFCDTDDDGVQDPGEPGIEGVTVNLTCAGGDMILGSADDFTDSRTTDADGMYLFDGLVPDLCKVEVDVASAPADKVPGRCPLAFTIDLGTGQSFLEADFCFITPGQVGDTVFCDLDDDGFQDPGEPGIEGVTVDLTCAGPDGVLDTADDFVDSRTTDADGAYLFTDVPAGDCRVEVELASAPPDKEPGRCPTSVDVTLSPGQSFLEADFCFRFPPGEIGDTVFCDLDDDGFQDPGEPGIEGVTVDLTCAGIDGTLGTADDTTDSKDTDADGHYLFTGVAPGPCKVEVDLTTAPPDKVVGLCPIEYTLDLAPAESFLDADFCFVTPPPGTIGDTVFCDGDDDGFQDPGEPGISGVLVELTCAGPDGMLGTADDLTASQTTDADGHYAFEGLPAGECEVAVDASTAPADKEAGECPLSFLVDLQSGQTFLDADFCFRDQPGEIGDTVFCDNDDDGFQDPGDPGIEGVTVELTCAGPDGALGTADDLVASQATDADGHYLFTDVPAGACRVEVDESTAPADKILGRCPVSFSVDLPPAGSFLDADFCFVTPASIGDTVFCDLDDDGFQDPGEPGIEGVTIELTCAGPDGVIGTADDLTDSRSTDANGNYLFTELPPGACDVAVDPSSGPADKEPGQCPLTVAVALDPGEAFLDADFCFRFPPTADCCENGKPIALTMLYTGEDCSATSHTQDDGKVSCSGDPAFAATVHIIASDDEDPNDGGAKVWFDGEVDLNSFFDIVAANAGEDRLKSNTWVHVLDLSGGVLQSVEFHTSCSQPLFTGDQFGSLILVDCIGEDEPGPGGDDLCDAGDPQMLEMRYTGEDCSVTSHSQDDGKVSCSGDPAFAATVHIIASDKEDPEDDKAKVWFGGDVDLNATFVIDATNAGEDKLKSNTWVHVLDLTGGTLQTIEFHTSCSQPLGLGDRFGSLLLEGFVPE